MIGSDLDDLTIDQLKDMVALLCNKVGDLSEQVNDLNKVDPSRPTKWISPTFTGPATIRPGIVTSSTADFLTIAVDDDDEVQF